MHLIWRRAGKGTDPDAMIYDLSSDQLNHSLDKIAMVTEILKNLKRNTQKEMIHMKNFIDLIEL